MKRYKDTQDDWAMMIDIETNDLDKHLAGTVKYRRPWCNCVDISLGASI